LLVSVKCRGRGASNGYCVSYSGDYGGCPGKPPFWARWRSSVRYGTRLGDLKESCFYFVFQLKSPMRAGANFAPAVITEIIFLPNFRTGGLGPLLNTLFLGRKIGWGFKTQLQGLLRNLLSVLLHHWNKDAREEQSQPVTGGNQINGVEDQPQCRGMCHSVSPSAHSFFRSPSPPPPSFTQSPSPQRSLVCDGQASPPRPRLVVSCTTCPPLSPFPDANSFVIGNAVINTHTHMPCAAF